jgi:integrase
VRIEEFASAVSEQAVKAQVGKDQAGKNAEEAMKGVYEKKPGSSIWYVRFADKTGRIRKEKAGTKSAAEKLYMKRKNQVLEGKKLPETLRRRVILFSEIAEDALKFSRANKRSFRDDEQRMKILKKWFGSREAESIGPQEVSVRLCQAADANKWANGTFNQYRALMMMVFREAHRNEKIPVTVNPARFVRGRRVDNSRVVQLTADQEVRLRKAIRGKYRSHEPELDLALNTGLRQGNQYALDFKMVDWGNRMLHIPRTKNDEPLHVALNQAALNALLRVRRRGVKSGRVFLAKKTGMPLRGPRTWFDAALKDAKIENFHWHDLRHTFASRLRQKGTKLEDIAEALGHKDLMMSKRYAHLGPRGLHDVVAMLDEKPTGPKTGPELVSGEGDKTVRLVN